MKQCMLDLETLSNRPGAVVLSIGACCFDADSVGETFYTVLSVADQVEAGAHVLESTVEWWHGQSEDARQVIKGAYATTDSTPAGLEHFSAWWKRQGAQFVWGNGGAFDDPILTETYRLFDMAPPWKFWDSRCHRTLKALLPQVKAPPFQGTKHRADADAAHQALHASAILRHIRDIGSLRIGPPAYNTGQQFGTIEALAAAVVGEPASKGLSTDAAQEDLGTALARLRKERT